MIGGSYPVTPKASSAREFVIRGRPGSTNRLRFGPLAGYSGNAKVSRAKERAGEVGPDGAATRSKTLCDAVGYSLVEANVFRQRRMQRSDHFMVFHYSATVIHISRVGIRIRAFKNYLLSEQTAEALGLLGQVFKHPNEIEDFHVHLAEVHAGV